MPDKPEVVGVETHLGETPKLLRGRSPYSPKLCCIFFYYWGRGPYWKLARGLQSIRYGDKKMCDDIKISTESLYYTIPLNPMLNYQTRHTETKYISWGIKKARTNTTDMRR